MELARISNLEVSVNNADIRVRVFDNPMYPGCDINLKIDSLGTFILESNIPSEGAEEQAGLLNRGIEAGYKVTLDPSSRRASMPPVYESDLTNYTL